MEISLYKVKLVIKIHQMKISVSANLTDVLEDFSRGIFELENEGIFQ